MYGREIREKFAIAYAHSGNATHALIQVLGNERAERMQRHTIRAKASTLYNDYRTRELIEQEWQRMRERGERLPKYRKSTTRTDLISQESEPIAPNFWDEFRKLRRMMGRFNK